MSWKPELSWTCPPRVVFDVLDRRDSIQQPRGHSKYPGWRKKGGHQPARARTRQRAPAGKARRSGRPKPTLRQTKTNNSQGRMDGAEGRKRLENKPGPKKLSIGRVAPTIIPLLCWEDPRLSVASVHWVEGVSRPSPPEKDRPSKRKLSNSIPRWLPIGRTPRLCARRSLGKQGLRPLFGVEFTPLGTSDSTHRERYGVRMERRCCYCCK